MSKKTPASEKAIRLFIADNKTEKAIQGLSIYLEKYNLPDLQDKFSILSAKWEALEEKQNMGSASFENISEEKARIDAALLSLNRNLFNKINTFSPSTGLDESKQLPSKGIREDKFKTHVLVLLLVSKLIIIGSVIFYLSVDALNGNQAIAIIAMILPVLSVYLGVIFDDFLGNRYVSDKQELYPFVKNGLRWLTYLLFFLYVIFTLIVIRNQAAGLYCDDWAMTAGDQLKNIPEEIAQKYCSGLTTLSKWMGFIETGLGAFIGKVVLSLFKKEK